MGMVCGTGQFFQRGVAAEEVMDGGSGDIYLFIQFIRPQHEIV